jgi:LmbE family N-acetylglucosaminyl deacetylase
MSDLQPEEATPGVPERAGPAPADAPEPPAPERVMSIHAHPDDQEFTIGGTLAKWAKAGSHIVTVCITSGGAGSNEWTPKDMTRAAW